MKFNFFKHTKKAIYLFLTSLIFLTGCQRNEVIKTHGIAYLENREKLIVVNRSNKNDAIKVFGHPATKGMTNDNMWIYIERTTTRGKLLKLGRTHLKKNNVLILEFDKYGVLSKKEFYDKDNMKKIREETISKMGLTFDPITKQQTDNKKRKDNIICTFCST